MKELYGLLWKLLHLALQRQKSEHLGDLDHLGIEQSHGQDLVLRHMEVSHMVGLYDYKNKINNEEEGGSTVIIQRKINKKHGAHGGSWKVAYADFVTAMMAFFLMLWLLSMLCYTNTFIYVYIYILMYIAKYV